MDNENFISILLFLVRSFQIYIYGYTFSETVFSMRRYGVISRKSSVLIIGGRIDGKDSSLIAKYTIDKWELVGNLQTPRNGHRAIANGDRIYVVGGHGKL